MKSVSQSVRDGTRRAAVSRGRRAGWPPRHEQAHGARRGVAELQRSRLLNAVVRAASERGYDGISVAAVVADARVSRRTFYEFFDSSEDCLLAVCEEHLAAMGQALAPVYERRGAWSQRLRLALTRALELLEGERDVGLLMLAYLLGAGPKGPGRRAPALALLISVLEDGRSQAPAGCQPSPIAAEVLLAGAVGVLHRQLAQRERPLVELVNPLMSMLVLPYLGAGAAARELKRTAPKRRKRPHKPSGDPCKELGMRMTYRTALVLAAIARTPGLSNIELASAAEIKDQGQISKLLSRLAHLGLIENIGPGHHRGSSNAWRLTTLGRDVQSTLKDQSVNSVVLRAQLRELK
jgi:AcrR family transcriptional regulator/DNA-binding MarR family transcriptional regulator